MRAAWSELEGYLRSFASRLEQQPRAILIVSGHWEEDQPTFNGAPAPALLFDYEGFPDHTYRLTWPAPGSPELAARARILLEAAGIESGVETRRGWDHGVFVPMKVMLPSADIPVVQLSLQSGLDPARHLAIGKALKPLRKDGVLIVGSGQTYHNMRGFMSGGGRADPEAEAFDAWLKRSMLDGERRDRSLLGWEDAPGARQAQPHEDHLLPLMVAAGAASGEPGQVAFQGHALGKPICGFRFG